MREKELHIQRQAVKTFLKGIEPLELVPWTPGYEPAENNNEQENSVMAAVVTSKQDVNANDDRPRTRSVGSAYNTKDLTGLGKRGSNDGSVKMVNRKVPLNAWT